MRKRIGKREREARNRHKRGTCTHMIPTPSGLEWSTVKLGNRKSSAYWHCTLSSNSRKHCRLGVDDAESRSKSDEGETNVSQPISSPARRRPERSQNLGKEYYKVRRGLPAPGGSGCIGKAACLARTRLRDSANYEQSHKRLRD